MKYKLLLTFDETEDDRLRTYVDAEKWSQVVWEIDQWLRGQTKYENKDYSEAREMLHSIITDYGLSLEM